MDVCTYAFSGVEGLHASYISAQSDKTFFSISLYTGRFAAHHMVFSDYLVLIERIISIFLDMKNSCVNAYEVYVEGFYTSEISI